MNINRGRRWLSLLGLAFGLMFFGLRVAGILGLIPASQWHSGRGYNHQPSPEAPYMFVLVGGAAASAAFWLFAYRDEVTLDFNKRQITRRKGLRVRTGAFEEADSVVITGLRLPRGAPRCTNSVALAWKDPDDTCVLETYIVRRDDQFVLRFAGAYAEGLGLRLDDRRTA